MADPSAGRPRSLGREAHLADAEAVVPGGRRLPVGASTWATTHGSSSLDARGDLVSLGASASTSATGGKQLSHLLSVVSRRPACACEKPRASRGWLAARGRAPVSA